MGKFSKADLTERGTKVEIRSVVIDLAGVNVAGNGIYTTGKRPQLIAVRGNIGDAISLIEGRGWVWTREERVKQCAGIASA